MRLSSTAEACRSTTAGRGAGADSAANPRSGSGMSRVDIGASRRSRGRRRKFASGKHDRHVDHRTVQDGFVHVSNGGLGVRLVDVEDIRGAAIRVD